MRRSLRNTLFSIADSQFANDRTAAATARFGAASAGDQLMSAGTYTLATAGYAEATSLALSSFAKNYTARVDLGAGSLGVTDPRNIGVPTLLNDEAGGGINVAPGNPTITVNDATPHYATINTIGDQDYFKVTLEAGKTYQIGQYQAATTGPNGIPLPDAYFELRDSLGNLIATADGGGPNTPSGLDALLTYAATVTGTYYINFKAFDQDPTNGTDGDGIGDYQYFVKTIDPNDPSIYRPYYEPDSPLYAIDWGTRVNKVNQSAANPDGNEGPRDTGNAQGTPTFGSKLDMNAILAANNKTAADIQGKNVITIYFAKAGDVFVSNDLTNPGLPPATITATGVKDYEHTAVIVALGEFSKVADIVYLEVQDRSQADFIYTSYAGTPGPGVSLLGSMSPPDESDEGLAQFNSADERWNARDLAQGGFSFVTLIHEFGHGHGLAHPHDNGGHSGIMNGVTSDGPVADYTTGQFELNQGVFTMMSYEDGWQSSPYGNAPTNVGYGYLGGLMAFDIAAIQDKYGVNEDWATGDDVYTLKDVNAAGTFFSSIWDAGGNDSIVYSGVKNTTIDLRPATLQYEVGGGGFVSFATGIYGGFTIANSVVIENATSGGGNDKLTGNSANNILAGNGGNDQLFLQGGGNDTALGGDGDDYIYFGDTWNSLDTVDGGAGKDTLGLAGNYTVTMGATSLTGIEKIIVYGASAVGGTGVYNYSLTMAEANVASGQEFMVYATTLGAGESLLFNGYAETDGGRFTVIGGAGNDTIAGGGGVDYLAGGAGNDTLYGLGGQDFLTGGAGQDTLRGGAGSDHFRYTSVGDSTVDNPDRILDLEGWDVIDLTGIDANSGIDGDQAFTFIGNAAFTAAGQLRAVFDDVSGLWNVSGDVNGDGTADFLIQVNVAANSPQIVVSEFAL
jgi:hypothetical protein